MPRRIDQLAPQGNITGYLNIPPEPPRHAIRHQVKGGGIVNRIDTSRFSDHGSGASPRNFSTSAPMSSACYNDAHDDCRRRPADCACDHHEKERMPA